MSTARRAVGTWEWGARAGHDQNLATPEELVAAAQSTCFNTGLAQELSLGGTPPPNIRTAVEVSSTAGEGITEFLLEVQAVVPRFTSEQFGRISIQAKENCSVTRALSATRITLRTELVVGEGRFPLGADRQHA